MNQSNQAVPAHAAQAEPATPVAQAASLPAEAAALELDEFAPRQPAGTPLLSTKAGLFDSVKVGVSVVVGQAQSTVSELMALKELSILKIDRGLDCPVDVVVNGIVIARGQLVAVDDYFGVKITEVAKGMQG